MISPSLPNMVFFRGSTRLIAFIETDLPEPDSPTIANVSPRFRLKVTPRTASTMPSSVRNDTCKLFTFNIVSVVIAVHPFSYTAASAAPAADAGCITFTEHAVSICNYSVRLFKMPLIEVIQGTFPEILNSTNEILALYVNLIGFVQAGNELIIAHICLNFFVSCFACFRIR